MVKCYDDINNTKDVDKVNWDNLMKLKMYLGVLE